MVQKSQWPVWETIRLIILGNGLNSHQSFGQCLKVLANLINLFSRNLGKAPLKCTHSNKGCVTLNNLSGKFEL